MAIVKQFLEKIILKGIFLPKQTWSQLLKDQYFYIRRGCLSYQIDFETIPIFLIV